MKHLTLVIPLLLALADASAAELKISATEPLVVTASDGWVAAASARSAAAFPLATLRIVPTGDRNAVCLISILDKNRSEFKDQQILKNVLRADSRPYLNSPEESVKMAVKELAIPGGLGFYANFVDPNLVANPVRKGSYKTATPIILSIGSDYLVKATILCDDSEGRDYNEALEIVKSIKVAKPSA
jgi:hypothetical protein